MTGSGLLLFAVIYALSVATPGPGVAAVIARSLASGTRGAAAFIGGFIAGDLLWFTAAATGLSALAQNAHTAFVVLKYAGALYLLYLSIRMWTASPDLRDADTAEIERSGSRLFLGSLTLTLSNPKPMIFFLALLPTVITLQTLTVAGFLEIATIIAIVLPVVLGSYVLAAARARQVLRSRRAVRIMNRGSAAIMAGAAVAVSRS
jgi:threonine/homoserine/homoserine lactone efflux protein